MLLLLAAKSPDTLRPLPAPQEERSRARVDGVQPGPATQRCDETLGPARRGAVGSNVGDAGRNSTTENSDSRKEVPCPTLCSDQRRHSPARAGHGTNLGPASARMSVYKNFNYERIQNETSNKNALSLHMLGIFAPDS